MAARIAGIEHAADVLIEELAVVHAELSHRRDLTLDRLPRPVLCQAEIAAKAEYRAVAHRRLNLAPGPAYHVAGKTFALELGLAGIAGEEVLLRPRRSRAVQPKQIAATVEGVTKLGKLLLAAIRRPDVWRAPRRRSLPVREKNENLGVEKLAVLLDFVHDANIREIAVGRHVAAIHALAAHGADKRDGRILHPCRALRLRLELRESPHPVAIQRAGLHPATGVGTKDVFPIRTPRAVRREVAAERLQRKTGAQSVNRRELGGLGCVMRIDCGEIHAEAVGVRGEELHLRPARIQCAE